MDMQAFDTAPVATAEVTIDGGPIAAPWWRRAAVLDRAEQVMIPLLWIWLVARAVYAFVYGHNAFALIPPISESAVIVFVLIRRPTEAISLDLGPWLLAIVATGAPLLIATGPVVWPALAPAGMVLLGAGQIVQLGAKLSLRRSFGIAPANRGIKCDGLYRFVRHPMYAGYLLTHMAIMVLMPSLLNAAIYGIGWIAQIHRLKAEEALLGQDPAYRAYLGKVRWRLIPGLF